MCLLGEAEQRMKRWEHQGENATGLAVQTPPLVPAAVSCLERAPWLPCFPVLSILQGGRSTCWVVPSLCQDAAQGPTFSFSVPCFPPYNCKGDSVFMVENWLLQQYSFLKTEFWHIFNITMETAVPSNSLIRDSSRTQVCVGVFYHPPN